jgi:DNA recombination protein RmuC
VRCGNQNKIDLAQKQLLKAIESFAKDISTKYIDPPNTTDFAIMFLPIESLYGNNQIFTISSLIP